MSIATFHHRVRDLSDRDELVHAARLITRDVEGVMQLLNEGEEPASGWMNWL